MTGGGFAGWVLDVDLTSGRIAKHALDMSLVEDFIGGFGLTIRLAYDAIRPGFDALSPDNPIVMGVGPLVGTSLPATSRVYAVTKLPTSGTIGWCGAGGVTFGYQFKCAGYDHLIIRGRSEKPVYLRIMDDRVELVDARSCWGRSIDETSEAFWKEMGWPTGVLAIGQAGECQVAFAMAYIDRIATLGRGGFGAVMGAKNLKAIVVQGTGGVRVADRKKYRELSESFLRTIRDYPYLKEWQDLGLLKSFPVMPAEQYHRIRKRRLACVSCPVGCKDAVEIPDGPHQGLVAYSSSAVNLSTPVLYGFQDYRDGIRLIATLDGYGLDMFEFFGVTRFVKTLVDNGLIPLERVQPPIVNDSLASLETWAERIALREGLGDILADGFRGVVREFGPETVQFAPALVKWMHPYAGPGAALPWDMFGTMELGQVLDPRGPHVGAGGSPTYFAKRPLEVFPKHFRRMGIPEAAFARILPGRDASGREQGLRIGRLLKYSHNWFTILGSLGICARGQVNRFYHADLCARLYEAVTGIAIDLPGLRKRADRIWTLYRMVNIREGLQRSQAEILPDQWFVASGFKDYFTEEPLDIESSERMIEDYYQEWGWEPKTGVPSAETLNDLGLK